LLEVSRVILGTPTEENALGTVLDQMWRVVRYQAAAAVILEGEELRVAGSRGGRAGVRVPPGSSGELVLLLGRPPPLLRSGAPARAANVAGLTRLAATRLEPEALLGAAGEEILPLSGADRVVLYVAHARNAVLIPVAHEGTAPAEEKRVTELRLDLSAPLLAPLVEERKTLVFQGETGPPPDSVSPFLGARSLLLIPL